jgi:hypothetical protein
MDTAPESRNLPGFPLTKYLLVSGIPIVKASFDDDTNTVFLYVNGMGQKRPELYEENGKLIFKTQLSSLIDPENDESDVSFFESLVLYQSSIIKPISGSIEKTSGEPFHYLNHNCYIDTENRYGIIILAIKMDSCEEK